MVFCNIDQDWYISKIRDGHNPYFSRWFSAIIPDSEYGVYEPIVTILILVDGFLQLTLLLNWYANYQVTILILVDGFLQYMYVLVTLDNFESQSLF